MIGSRQEISTASYIGVVYAVIALIAMSAGSIYEKRFGVKQHPVVATIVQFTVGFIVIWPIAYFREAMQINFTPELSSLWPTWSSATRSLPYRCCST